MDKIVLRIDASIFQPSTSRAVWNPYTGSYEEGGSFGNMFNNGTGVDVCVLIYRSEREKGWKQRNSKCKYI